jgi:hypothetical protein
MHLLTILISRKKDKNILIRIDETERSITRIKVTNNREILVNKENNLEFNEGVCCPKFIDPNNYYTYLEDYDPISYHGDIDDDDFLRKVNNTIDKKLISIARDLLLPIENEIEIIDFDNTYADIKEINFDGTWVCKQENKESIKLEGYRNYPLKRTLISLMKRYKEIKFGELYDGLDLKENYAKCFRKYALGNNVPKKYRRMGVWYYELHKSEEHVNVWELHSGEYKYDELLSIYEEDHKKKEELKNKELKAKLGDVFSSRQVNWMSRDALYNQKRDSYSDVRRMVEDLGKDADYIATSNIDDYIKEND